MLKPRRKVQEKETPKVNFQDCLAKTRKLSSIECVSGRTVLEHCLIVGEIAKRLSKLYPNYEKLF